MIKHNNYKTTKSETNFDNLFLMFCLWVFIMMGRPQDYIVGLNAVRPVLFSTFLMILMFSFNTNKIHGPILLNSKQVKKFILLFIIMIIGIPASLHRRVSFDAILTGYILIVFFVLVFYKVVNSIDRLKFVVMVGCTGAGLYILVALRSGISVNNRLTFGAMFDPNDLAYYVLSFLPFYLFYCDRDNKIIIRIIAMTFYSSGVFLILMSGSRGGVIALGLSMLVFLIFTKKMKRPIKFLVLITCVIFISLAPINKKRYSTILNLENDYNVTAEGGRFDLWKIGIRLMMKNPLTGIGVECYPIAVGHDRQTRNRRS